MNKEEGRKNRKSKLKCNLKFSETTVSRYLSQYSVWIRGGRLGDRGSIPGRGERIFPLTTVSRQALGPTQPPVQWVPAVLSPGLKRGRGVTLTTHPHLFPRSRMSRSCTSSPPKSLCGVLWDSFSFSNETTINMFFHESGHKRFTHQNR
jgi:hypothetical protein